MLYHLASITKQFFQAVIMSADGTIMSIGNDINDIQDFSLDTLSLIMQFVPIQQRMGNCARVCRKFQAAVAATISSSSITVSPSSQERCDSFVRWLEQHGSRVMRIQIEFQGRYRLSQLPCPQLCHLDIDGVCLGPSFTEQDFLDCCTNLTHLVLSDCQYFKDSGNLASLLTLTKLQHLSIEVLLPFELPDSYGLPGDLLLHLDQLTYLQLSAQLVSSSVLKHLSALSALQHLGMNLYMVQDPGAVSGLQSLQQLTALRLRCGWTWGFNFQTMPALSQLTALRLLHLQQVDPAVLAGYSQLQELQLYVRGGAHAWTAEQTAAVLAAVGQQHELTKLSIECEDTWHTSSAAAFASLTASSHLQHLELANCKLSAAAWREMFPPERRLPELQFLSLSGTSARAAVDTVGLKALLQLRHADMQAMVSCCPGLVSLALCRGLGTGSVAPLRQLTGLKQLTLCAAGRAQFQDTALNLAQLTGLQDLRLFLQNSEELVKVTPSALLQLTVLQQLQRLLVTGAAFEPAREPLEVGLLRELWLDSQADDDAPPDVWLQLKNGCERFLAPERPRNGVDGVFLLGSFGPSRHEIFD